ncbi:hypothetical protein GALL_364130 [mine drainage metagenome]|uniref:Uncharacterized protein n=1 Tax=mine drainage metagenome TaxID=410659 RepID=A0A1J5QPJ3_9ZZZZ
MDHGQSTLVPIVCRDDELDLDATIVGADVDRRIGLLTDERRSRESLPDPFSTKPVLAC